MEKIKLGVRRKKSPFLTSLTSLCNKQIKYEKEPEIIVPTLHGANASESEEGISEHYAPGYGLTTGDDLHKMKPLGYPLWKS